MAKPQPSAATGLEVLIIDDNDIDREAIRRCFRGREVIIHEAATGMPGLELIRSRTFACVFLDYLLPDMDGTNLLKQLYDSNADLINSPIVMLTGQGSEAVMLDALRWGAQDYLVKEHISPTTLNIAMKKAQEMFELKRSRRQAEEQLQMNHKMEAIGQLTSGVAHDFNNLLTVVLGNLHLLKQRLETDREKIDPAYIEKKIQSIETVARNGAELVKRLMVFARQRPLSSTKVDLNHCVNETFELLKRSLGEAVEVEVILADRELPASVDTGELGNVLINIAVNARDAMPKGGKLTIETSGVALDEYYAARHPDITPGPYALIAISDTGTGMTAETARRIFEPFFTTKPAGKGTGLGLSMAYGFVRQSGGHIRVYSEENRGTVFRIYLPRIDAESESVAVQSAAALSPNRETILVAEDDDEVRGTALSMLEALGYRTLHASNGRTALELLKREHQNITLLFTDIGLGGDMNGIDLAAQMRGFYPGIKTLYTSGYTEKALPAYKLGEGDELLSKPYRKEALAEKIRKILQAPERETEKKNA